MALKEFREAAGLSQLKLDKLAGLDAGTVHKIEAGSNRNPTINVVAKIVSALRRQGLAGVTAEMLFPVADDAPADETQVPA